MKRLLMLACLVSLALPAWAADPDFTPEQRKAIVQILRDALRSDPSILRDAIGTLQADNQAREESEAKQRIAAKQQALFATPSDPVAGNARGDVTVVEFYDPRCPYCRRMVPAIDAMLRKDHGIRLIYKDIPVLGPASVTESRAILAAQAQGGYLKMQAALMANPEQPNDAMIRSIARQVGLDPDKLVADMNGAAVTAKIAENLNLAHELKVDGTPIFVIGSQMIPGAVDQAALESAIAAARRRG